MAKKLLKELPKKNFFFFKMLKKTKKNTKSKKNILQKTAKGYC